MRCLQPERSPIQMWPKVLDRFDYCSEFFPSGAVALLGSREGLAVVSQDHLTSTLNLRQNGSHTVVVGVSVQDELVGWIRIRQNWRLH